ncbi:hypothetical protein [Denitratimonas sp. CY0512]|uniref:hypothetical protein n=1 Tax=Denitratimonas sp. CY0512 TaxID=3131940 RepID=UPI0030A64748
MSLSVQQQELIREASRNAILNGLERGKKNFWHQGEWMPTENPYKTDCINKLKQVFSQGVTSINCRYLVEYIAASTVVHCFDGWSFLGRALDAELSGDSDTAKHLAYYAELRAAMSLLAGHGIGVFNDKHVIVKDDGFCYLFPRKDDGQYLRTHQFVWEALQYWGDLLPARDTLFNSIFPGNIPLGEWLNHYPGSANFVASHWLKQWGLDIARMAEDRDARNVASYRPSAFISPGCDSVQNTITSVCQLWELCEPRSQGGFQVMDRHILRASLHEAIKQKIDSEDEFERMVRSDVQTILDNISPQDLNESQWKEFLSRNEKHPVLAESAGTLSVNQVGHSRQVLSRALLLLRVATGSTSVLVKDCGGSKDSLNFWWSGSPVSRRLWEPDSPPDQFSDLWEDIGEAKDELIDAANSPHISYHSIWRQNSRQISVFPTTERVALWGLCL